MLSLGPQNYDFMSPFRAGIQKDRTSGYEKFEVSGDLRLRSPPTDRPLRLRILQSGVSEGMQS